MPSLQTQCARIGWDFVLRVFATAPGIIEKWQWSHQPCSRIKPPIQSSCEHSAGSCLTSEPPLAQTAVWLLTSWSVPGSLTFWAPAFFPPGPHSLLVPNYKFSFSGWTPGSFLEKGLQLSSRCRARASLQEISGFKLASCFKSRFWGAWFYHPSEGEKIVILETDWNVTQRGSAPSPHGVPAVAQFSMVSESS